MVLLHDLRVAARSLRRAPGFTGLTTGVLALGLAVVVVMFDIVHVVAYVPPPLPDPDSMVLVSTIDKVQNDFDRDVSSHDFVDWRREQTAFTDMAGYYSGTTILSGQGPAERLQGGFVSGTFFDLIGDAALI